jgi:hypothetical protein
METDTLANLVDYAEAQGSRNMRKKVYILYSQLVNSLVGIQSGEQETEPFKTLSVVAFLEDMILHTVDEEMQKGTHYKDIYKICKANGEQIMDLRTFPPRRSFQHSRQHIPVPQLHAQVPGGLYKIRIRLSKEDDQVKKRADSAQAACAYVNKPHANLAFIELMRADNAEEKTKQNRDPLVLWLSIKTVGIGGIHVVGVVDNNVGLLVWLLVWLLIGILAQIGNLLPAFWAHDALRVDDRAAVLAVFRCALRHSAALAYAGSSGYFGTAVSAVHLIFSPYV